MRDFGVARRDSGVSRRGLADPVPRLETEGPFLEAFGAELFGTLKLR